MSQKSFGQSEPDTLLAKDNKLIPLPSVSLNVGFGNGFTDVMLSKDGPSPFRQLGYQLTLTQRVAKALNIGFELYTGSIYGEEQRGTTNINYRTSLVSPRAIIEYNFYPLLKPDAKGRQLIRPFIGVGFGAVFFRSKGDLKDENGVAYQYWENGGIYAEMEGTTSEQEATVLERDFEYETELRDENLDGFRKYSQTAFSMPFSAGLRVQLSKNVGVNASFSYVVNFTDLIDNVNAESVGVRQGNSDFDNNLFGSVGLTVFLGTSKHSAKPKPRFEEQIADEKSETEDEKPEEIIAKADADKWDELAAISNQLIEASEAMAEISESSKSSLDEQSQKLTSIADRDLSSNKDLKAAKKESIELLDRSISVLAETKTELNETTGKVNAVAADLNSNNLDEQFAGAEKIRATVDETIPAVESLKEKIAAAKSPAELRSVLNITSKNLAHTKDIFSEESAQISGSISVARKTVAQARTENLMLEKIQSIEQIAAIESELEELNSQGVLSEEEYKRLKAAIEASEAKLEITQQNESDNEPQGSELESASQLLKNALNVFRETNRVADENLSTRRNELNSIAEKSIDSKKDLKTAKEEALRIVEQALEDLKLASESIDAASVELNQAEEKLEFADAESDLVNTKKVNASIAKTTELLEASKSRIKSSKNAEELKSVVNITSTNLDKTRNVIGTESETIASSIDQARKTLIINEFDLVSGEKPKTNVSATDNSNTLTESGVSSKGKEELQNQLDKLLADGLIDEEEYQEMKGSLAATPTLEFTTSTSAEIENTVHTEVDELGGKPKDSGVDQPAALNSVEGQNLQAESNSGISSDGTASSRKNNGSFDLETIEASEPKKTGAYHWADLNKDEWISPNEVLHFIDLLFEGEAERSVEDIQNLIDYYFDQE